ncbi:MAG: sulfite exporter TauE/SafE family protein [bacterium]|nr:sulfite exporter TauE/SafE family protein [bacterium]
MDLFPKISAGFLAGLSVGVYCLGLCLPVFLPVLLSQKQTAKTSFLLVLEFSLGRLLGYFIFGIIFGFIGQFIESNFVHYVAILVNIWLGFLLIIYSLGTLDKKICASFPFYKIRWPILLGFLTGVNVCPPFLASLFYVFGLKDVFASLLYFLMFFLGTSVYIVPAGLLGISTKADFIVGFARISGIAAGVYFIVQGIFRVWPIFPNLF